MSFADNMVQSIQDLNGGAACKRQYSQMATVLYEVARTENLQQNSQATIMQSKQVSEIFTVNHLKIYHSKKSEVEADGKT